MNKERKNTDFLMKGAVDRRGVPKSIKAKHTFRSANYYYRMFDYYGKILVDAGSRRFGY